MAQTQKQITATSVERKAPSSLVEFVIIIAMMMSLGALSIDAMLPALPDIAGDLAVSNENDRQLVVSVIFLGLAFGQLFFGPLSDKTGRKPAIYAGYALFITGSLVALFSNSFPMMLLGRVLQGLGISAPQAVIMAMVRDRFEGRQMARLMSFTMTIFVLVPMIAPTIGQAILLRGGWRSIFASFLVFALVTVTWFALRVPESLSPEKRAPFSLKRIGNAFLEVFGIRSTLGFALTAGFINGFFLGYLNSSQQIFAVQYGLGDKFPVFFAIISLSLGLASLLNARLVMRYGMLTLARWALRIVFGVAVVFLGISVALAGQPPLWLLMAYLMVSFFCTGILFGNLNTLAMQPVGHLAGIGAAVIGFLSTLLSMLLGTMIGRFYNGTILPLVIGMVCLAGISILVIRWVLAADPALTD